MMNIEDEETLFALDCDDVTIESVYNKETGRYIVPYNSYNVEMSNIKSWHEAGYTGKGVKIAIFDTGVMINHPLIKDNIVKTIDFTGEGIEDLSGHGTIVTLIALMTAPGVDLYIAKVLNKNRVGFEKHIIEGIKWVMENGVKIVNLSLGQIKNCSDDCKLKIEFDKAKNNGVIFCAAAGKNSNCPANCCISTGALNYKCDKIADYSGSADFYQSGTIGMYEVEIKNKK